MHIRFSTVGIGIAQEQNLMKRIEHTQTLKQLEILTMFVPNEVINHQRNTSHRPKNFVGVILYLDIMGVVALSERYDKVANGGINVFLKILKYCFGSVIEIITFYGGDVIKYTGDTFIAMWKVLPESSLSEDIHVCIMCGLLIQELFLRYTTPMHVQLEVKIVISCGNIQCGLIGNDETKAFAISGDAMKGIKSLCADVKNGEIFISNAAWSRLSNEHYDYVPAEAGVKLLRVIYSVNESEIKAEFAAKYIKCMQLVDAHKFHYMSDETTNKSKALTDLLEKIPPRHRMKYVGKSWSVDELMPFVVVPVKDYIRQWQPIEYLSAKHALTIQSISIIFKSGVHCTLPSKFIDEIYQDICEQIKTSLGILTKFSMIENEMVFVSLFGLRGMNREMDSLNALRSGFKMFSRTEYRPEVESCSICVTYGSVFCGVVGHPLRKEYIVLGEIVKKTRNIQKQHTNKVTCDYKTFTYSKLASFYFKVVKGNEIFADDFCYIFEYDETEVKLSDTVIKPQLFGREGVYNVLRTIIFFPDQISLYYGICIHGMRTIGKTAILRRLDYDLNESNNLIHASIELNSASTLPYFTVSKLYNQIYDQVASIKNDDIDIILNLPRTLWDLHKETLKTEEDISLQKYRILNYFRDLILCSANANFVVILIDNIEYMDLQSWEILLITLTDGFVRLICTATFTKKNWDLKFQISINENIKLFELPRLHDVNIPEFLCSCLNVVAISKDLVELVISTCDGLPGIICGYLLRLLNRNKLFYKLVRNYSDVNEMVYTQNDYASDAIVPACKLTATGKGTLDRSAMNSLSMELFESYDLFIQMIIKTAAVLGDLFARTLLITALKYPSEHNLSKALKYLFEEEIFECGSRYIYSEGIPGDKYCCRCYFDEDYFVNRTILPKYAYCRLIYFKKADMRISCYDIFPENHRKELHILASNFIENSITLCCFCMRNPAYRFIYFHSYKQIVDICINNGYYDDAMKNTNQSRMFEIQEVIRKSMAMNNESIEDEEEFANLLPIYDPRVCNCFEMCIRGYQDIIYHSEKAGLLSKCVFFSMLTGIALVILRDIAGAKPILEKAVLLCTIDMYEEEDAFPGNLRRFLLGRIELCLSKIAMALQKFNECKTHLVIALRQYNIPSVSLYYKPFKKFLTRTHLIKNKASIKQYVCSKNILIRYDMACCLCFTAKVLMAEGKVSFSKLATAYSLHLFKSVNPNIPILLDIYSHGVFVYRQSDNYDAIIKLQKITLRELQQCYASGSTYVLFSIGVLLENMFLIYYKMGKSEKGIRMGYRIFDLNQRFFTRIAEPSIIAIMIMLLGDTFRLTEAANLMSLVKENLTQFSIPAYVLGLTNLFFYLRCGLQLQPLEESIASIEGFYTRIPLDKLPPDRLQLLAILQVYYIRAGKFDEAMKFEIETDWKHQMATASLYHVLFLLRLEVKISFMLHDRIIVGNTADLDKQIRFMFKFIKNPIKKESHCLLPMYFMYSSWYAKIKGHNRKSKRLLKKTYQIALNHDNILVQAYTIQLRNCWYGGFTYEYNNRTDLDYRIVSEYSVAEWAQILYGYPVI